LRFHRLLTDDNSSGGGGSSSSSSGGGELHIYSSLPLEGAQRGQSTALVNGAKLALEQAGGKAGDFTITVSCAG
jgi:branched-chain amino acid transport system substrate-binding protein